MTIFKFHILNDKIIVKTRGIAPSVNPSETACMRTYYWNVKRFHVASFSRKRHTPFSVVLKIAFYIMQFCRFSRARATEKWSYFIIFMQIVQ